MSYGHRERLLRPPLFNTERKPAKRERERQAPSSILPGNSVIFFISAVLNPKSQYSCNLLFPTSIISLSFFNSPPFFCYSFYIMSPRCIPLLQCNYYSSREGFNRYSVDCFYALQKLEFFLPPGGLVDEKFSSLFMYLFSIKTFV